MISQRFYAIRAKKILLFLVLSITFTVKFSTTKAIYDVFEKLGDSLTMKRINAELQLINQATANLEWNMLTNTSTTTFRLIENLSRLKTTWKNHWCEQLANNDFEQTARNKKMIRMLCRGPMYSPDLARETTSIMNRLSAVYASSKVCRIENHERKCYNGEPDLTKLMTTSRNESELRWAWTAWRDEMSKVKSLFINLIYLQNIAARNNGYNDIGECWREEFEIPSLENFFENVYQQVKPLYKLLHAVVRFRLAEIYPETVDIRKPIPAHLLGNLWSQSWDSLIDLLLPKYVTLMPDINKTMKRKNYTVRAMVKKAEEFYQSIGFPPLTKEFWENSVFEKENRSGLNCHATAANMYTENDFRMFACLETTLNDLHVAYHEIGHIQYYMAYQNQSTIFKNGVNTGFHEAIGDAVMYGAVSFQHMQRLGFVDDSFLKPFSATPEKNPIEILELAALLRQALVKLPQLSTGIAMEKWRWEVFRGGYTAENFNELWWKMHRHYVGIVPPFRRSEDLFDPAAKFHVVNNIPYARYFLANILQVQLFEGMCEAAITGRVGNENFNMPLHKCDIYGSEVAGRRLRSMMKYGSSITWKQALRMTTGSSDYLVEPLLRYYEPVRKWLELEIKRHNIPVGWN